MRAAFVLVLALSPLVLACAAPRETAAWDDPAAGVEATLDALHRAAAEADLERYLGLFAADAVFLGTDASERWTVEELAAYARPRFATGVGWTYAPVERHVALGAGGEVAWFDELLRHARYGTLRGTGVLRRERGGWRVVRYDLHFVVPNEVAPEVVEAIAGARP